jgi:hypothetical protein
MGTKWGHDCVCVGLVSLVLSATSAENPIMASLEQRNGSYRVVFALTATSMAVRSRPKTRRSPTVHDGRLLTLEDTVEFHNLVLELKLTEKEKADLVAFLRCL